jgi:N-methylhydantoinase B/oxoprolinase/acetone carboxylase alpha subunit
LTVDVTTVEVIKGALIYAAEEMGIALKKSAYSPNIKERMDHSCALFNHRRELIAQAEHRPTGACLSRGTCCSSTTPTSAAPTSRTSLS